MKKDIKRFGTLFFTLTNYFELGLYISKNGFALWIGFLYLSIDIGEISSDIIFTINTSDGIVHNKKTTDQEEKIK